jgi:hypothetical protein
MRRVDMIRSGAAAEDEVTTEFDEEHDGGRAEVTLHLAELSGRLLPIIEHHVRRGLEDEARLVDAEAWTEEAVQAVRGLLSEQGGAWLDEDGAQSEELAAAAAVVESLRGEDAGLLMPEDAEVSERAREEARLLASAWTQCLAFALEDREEVVLDDSLLPRALDADVLRALRNSLDQLVIRLDGALVSLRELAVLLQAGPVLLPFGVELTRSSGGGWVARRGSRFTA